MLARDAWTFVGDPIDGTRPFAGGLSGWGVMVAACRAGWPRACVMNLPAWNEDRSRPSVPRRRRRRRAFFWLRAAAAPSGHRPAAAA